MKSLNTYRISLALTAFTLLGFATSKPAVAATIDFESIPGAYEGMEIGNQFLASHGITFSLEGGSLPILAQKGKQNGKTAGFTGYKGQPDTLAPGQNMGEFFLTTPKSKRFNPLIITYTNPVSAAYGELFDIDGKEAWSIEARDNTGLLIDSVAFGSGDSGTGDALATPWSFKRENADIYSIRMVYTGKTAVGIGGVVPGGVGLGFDNFSPTSSSPDPIKSVPEPSSVLGLLVFGTFNVSSLLKRKRQQKVLNCALTDR
ncbi:MAG TPA: PEP-CTERM sorting domain-containing protein [Leptolyngbyaceae cyanobacterium]